MTNKVSLDKSKIKFVLLEGVHQSALDTLHAAGYTNIDFYKKALDGDELKEAISKYIVEKDNKSDDLTGNMVSQGTTPRRLTDLIGSLADLTSGSGDKGTPIIYIQGYFDNYTK